MSNKNNGGTAFPQVTRLEHEHRGMTLRDYFAAKSMQAYFSDPNASFKIDVVEFAAKTSYIIADAMLAERIK